MINGDDFGYSDKIKIVQKKNIT